MTTVRLVLDMQVGDKALTREQVNSVKKALTDFAGISAKTHWDLLPTVTKPTASWHVHQGGDGCNICNQLVHDGIQ